MHNLSTGAHRHRQPADQKTLLCINTVQTHAAMQPTTTTQTHKVRARTHSHKYIYIYSYKSRFHRRELVRWKLSQTHLLQLQGLDGLFPFACTHHIRSREKHARGE